MQKIQASIIAPINNKTEIIVSIVSPNVIITQTGVVVNSTQKNNILQLSYLTYPYFPF